MSRAPMPPIADIKANTIAAIRWRKESHLYAARVCKGRIDIGCDKYGPNAWAKGLPSYVYLARCASRELWGGPRP